MNNEDSKFERFPGERWGSNPGSNPEAKEWEEAMKARDVPPFRGWGGEGGAPGEVDGVPGEMMDGAPADAGRERLGSEESDKGANEVSETEKSEYQRITSGTTSWCGTGRYAMGANGERIDILDRIFRGGGLATGAGDEEDPGKMMAPFSTNREESLAKAEGGESEGGSGEGASGSFNTGSKIAGDYPILLGVKNMEGGQPLANLPWDEVRASGGVNLDSFTHIEVPKENIEETRALLEKYGVALPVVAIGVGTAVALGKIEKAKARHDEKKAEELAKGEVPEEELKGGEGETSAEGDAESAERGVEANGGVEEMSEEEKDDAERIKEEKQKLIDEAKGYYETEEEGVPLPGSLHQYLGDNAASLVEGVKREAKSERLDRDGFVDSLMAALGREELDRISHEIAQNVGVEAEKMKKEAQNAKTDEEKDLED